MVTERKFYKTTFVVEILSETPGVGEMSLTDVLTEAENGSFSGDVKSSEEVEVDGPTMAKLLSDQRSDPEFFNLDENGNDLDDGSEADV